MVLFDARRTTPATATSAGKHDAARFFSGWGILLGVPAIFVAAYIYPLLPYVSNLEICALRRVLKVPCPGCGLTTSFAAIAHGDLRAAMVAHPLSIVIAIWLVYLFFQSLITAVSGKRPRELLTQRQRDWLLGLFVVAMFVRWFAILLGRYL